MNWIKTSDAIPEQFVTVLACYGKSRCCYLAYVNNDGLWKMDEDGDEATTPTHWMPLPEPPK